MAKHLVLGGAGFIGYHLVRALAGGASDDILLVDNLSRGHADEELQTLLNAHATVRLVVGDLTDPLTLRRLPGPFDRVYLLAGIVGVRNVQDDPAEVIRTNVRIIFNTLEWLAEVGCGRLLFASTSETYADGVELGVVPVPTAEQVPLVIRDIQHPRSSYALSKMLGEAAVSHAARQGGFEAVIARYHNVYGPRMGCDHVIPELMQRLHRKMNPLPVYGLEQSRAFCYIDDAIQASCALMRCPLAHCEIVHVGTPQEVTVRQVVEKLQDLAEFHPEIQALPAPSGSVARRCPQISRLRALTGFEPKVDLDRGLALTWEWYRHACAEHD